MSLNLLRILLVVMTSGVSEEFIIQKQGNGFRIKFTLSTFWGCFSKQTVRTERYAIEADNILVVVHPVHTALTYNLGIKII